MWLRWWLFSGTYDVGLLRDKGVRAIVHRGSRERVERHGRDCDGTMSGVDVNRIRRSFGYRALKLLQRGGIMEAGQVADEAYRGFLRGKTFIMPGARNRSWRSFRG